MNKETKWTPGPYSTSGIPGDNHIMARVPVKIGKVTVAIIPGWDGITPEEYEANKELFRSAPELAQRCERLEAALDALLPMAEKLLEVSQSCDGICDSKVNAEYDIEQARAALDGRAA